MREVLEKKEQIEPFDKLVVKYADMILRVKPLCSVIYLEVFRKKDDDKTIMELLQENEEILKEVAKEAGLELEDVIIPKNLKIKMYKDDEDPVQVFNRGKMISPNVSKFQSCLIQHLPTNNLEIHRVYTFEKENVDKLKKSIEKAIVKYCPSQTYNYY